MSIKRAGMIASLILMLFLLTGGYYVQVLKLQEHIYNRSNIKWSFVHDKFELITLIIFHDLFIHC